MKTGEEAVERAELKSLKAVSIAGLFLVAVIWGSTFTANKIVLETLSPISLMAVRFLMAFAAMALIFRKRFAVLTTGAVKGGILCGISLFLAFVLQTYGLLYTDAGKQAFLSGAYVFRSLLAVLILGETFTLRMISGAAAILISILITES